MLSPVNNEHTNHFESPLIFLTRVTLYIFHADRTENSVLLLRQEYRTVDKSHDSQPVLLECDIMRLRGCVFTEP
jgi:hypothetical protein